MDDSFFGFDTSEPLLDNGLGGALEEPPEETYDALNDETFGAAVNGDWEEVHEHLVQTDNKDDLPAKSSQLLKAKNALAGIAPHIGDGTRNSTPEPIGSELKRKKGNVAEHRDESESLSYRLSAFDFDKSDLFDWGAPQPPRPTNGVDLSQHEKREELGSAFCAPPQRTAPKFITLEDIERNMLMTQQQQNKTGASLSTHTSRTATPIGQPIQAANLPVPPVNVALVRPPPGLGPIRPPPHILQPHLAPNQFRYPPGFNIFPPGFGPNPAALHQHPQLPPHLMLQHRLGLPPNHPLANQRAMHGPNFPTALNNFAMHPNFNPLCAAQPGFVPPAQLNRLPFPSPLAHMMPHQSNNAANMRLVQEIQQNHPLLQNAAWQQHQMLMNRQRPGATAGITDNADIAPQHQQQKQQPQQQQQWQNVHKNRNGNAIVKDEYPQYTNLMSNRDKHWLIHIQLTQLNTETPYIDDYYHTVYKERQAQRSGILQNSQAHKNNQLYHPWSQVREHVQHILVQMGNKNGQRNGQHRDRDHRDRRSSENGNCNGSDGSKQQASAPPKLESSLGKLQYCSVTAPRKIIDADIMGSETGADAPDGTKEDTSGKQISTPAGAITNLTDASSNASKKTRHILLHIETLYLYLLKLEDLNNPVAVETIVLKKKKESERVAAAELMESIHKTAEERALSAANPALKNKFNYELESREALMQKVHGGLTSDKVSAIMNIRKGKTLVRRLLPHIIDHEARRHIWCGIFAALQNMLKKGREDAESVLRPLAVEFQKYLQDSDWRELVNLADTIVANDRNLTGLLCSKFGISSLVAMMLRAENLCEATDANRNDDLRKWGEFLVHVSTSISQTLENNTISAAIEADTVKPMLKHISRFQNLQLNALLALVNQAKQQIT